MNVPRLTVRLKLAAVFGGLFLVVGAGLLVLNYGLVRSSLPQPDVSFSEEVAGPADRIRVRRSAAAGQAAVAPDGSIVFVDGVPEDIAVLADLPSELRDDALDRLVNMSLIALAVAGVAAVGLGWVVAGRALRPLKNITAAARRLSYRNLHERIALEGPDDELKELADTFDSMLGRLDATFDSQRRFAANASHELRTPLAVIRTEVDVALADPDTTLEQLKAAADRIRTMTQRSQVLIDRLLLLAHCEEVALAHEPVDLAAECWAVLEESAGEATARGVRFETTLDEGELTGDRELLHQLVRNLVENAVRYNVEGGHVAVRCTFGEEVRLSVANTGPTVPADAVDRLFEPFTRLALDRTQSASGTGLGLSIVRSIADAHGGTVEAVSRPGGGLVVNVRLPREPVLAAPAP